MLVNIEPVFLDRPSAAAFLILSESTLGQLVRKSDLLKALCPALSGGHPARAEG